MCSWTSWNLKSTWAIGATGFAIYRLVLSREFAGGPLGLESLKRSATQQFGSFAIGATAYGEILNRHKQEFTKVQSWIPL